MGTLPLFIYKVFILRSSVIYFIYYILRSSKDATDVHTHAIIVAGRTPWQRDVTSALRHVCTSRSEPGTWPMVALLFLSSTWNDTFTV